MQTNYLLTIQETLNDTVRLFGLVTFKEIELDFLKEYVRCLKPIAEGIRSLEGEKSTFYGCLLPELMRMQRILTSLHSEGLTFCIPLVEVLTQSLTKRFEKFFNLEDPKAKEGVLASVSHPFFKLKWVPMINREFIKNLLIEEVRKLNQKDPTNFNIPTEAIQDRESYYMFLDDPNCSASSDHNSNTTAMDLEVLQYLSDNNINLNSLDKYPNIKNLFLKYNTCLPSSAPVERLFSFGGMIMRPHRRKMNDEIFEKLVILKTVK